MDDRCDRYQICRYRFTDMRMCSYIMGPRPCEEYVVGTCETNETMMQKWGRKKDEKGNEQEEVRHLR